LAADSLFAGIGSAPPTGSEQGSSPASGSSTPTTARKAVLDAKKLNKPNAGLQVRRRAILFWALVFGRNEEDLPAG
jgi:hypothetical protein